MHFLGDGEELFLERSLNLPRGSFIFGKEVFIALAKSRAVGVVLRFRFVAKLLKEFCGFDISQRVLFSAWPGPAAHEK